MLSDEIILADVATRMSLQTLLGVDDKLSTVFTPGHPGSSAGCSW